MDHRNELRGPCDRVCSRRPGKLRGVAATGVRLVCAAISVIGLASAVLALTAAATALAQDYSRVAPKSLPGSGSGTVETPQPVAPIAPSPESGRRILDRLEGIRLVDKPSRIDVNGAHEKGITLAGLDALDQSSLLEHLLRTYINRPLTQDVLKAIAQDIQNWYRGKDRPFVAVSYPAQDVSTNVLQVLVTEYRLRRVVSLGNEWFASDLLTNRIRAGTGQPILASQLSQDIVYLNQNPFRQTVASVEIDKSSDEADIVLHTDDRFPVREYATFDNDGVPSVGVNRYGFGVLWGNVFGLDQQLSYQFTSTDDFWGRLGHVAVEPGGATMAAHSVSYAIPLPWRDSISIFGDYEQDRPELGTVFSQEGVSWQASARYDAKLAPLWDIQQEAQFGIDYKHTNNNLAFYGYEVLAAASEIVQFPVLYSAARPDDAGQTQFSDLLVLSPGRLTSESNDAAFEHFSADAHARYAYDLLTLSRINRLPYDFTGILRGQIQWSTSNLLPSEELGAGGVESVRGYDERTAAGSEGELVTAEIRTPPISPLDRGWGAGHDDALQFDVFWDGAHVRNNTIAAGRPVSLDSVGGGLHYTLNRFVDLRLENGWQLRKAPGERRRSSRVSLSVVVGS
jgi:hemolysin activation/secretion protein